VCVRPGPRRLDGDETQPKRLAETAEEIENRSIDARSDRGAWLKLKKRGGGSKKSEILSVVMRIAGPAHFLTRSKPLTDQLTQSSSTKSVGRCVAPKSIQFRSDSNTHQTPQRCYRNNPNNPPQEHFIRERGGSEARNGPVSRNVETTRRYLQGLAPKDLPQL
jgi:hypothetical protein